MLSTSSHSADVSHSVPSARRASAPFDANGAGDWRGVLATALDRSSDAQATLARERAASPFALGDVWWMSILGVALATLASNEVAATEPPVIVAQSSPPASSGGAAPAEPGQPFPAPSLPLLTPPPAATSSDGRPAQEQGATPTEQSSSTATEKPGSTETNVQVQKSPARGSATAPELLGLATADLGGASPPPPPAGDVPASQVQTVVGTPDADLFTVGNAVDIAALFGNGGNDTVDFSGVTDLSPPTRDDTRDDVIGPDRPVELLRQSEAPNGVVVDLSANGVTVTTSEGELSVQAWRLDGNGVAAAPLAHIEGIDNVVGTIGNDVLIGNANANTFTYTAGEANGVATFGVDIYVGGGAGKEDAGDTADFSRLAATGVEGEGKAALPDGATGISVDLAVVVSVSMTDPLTGQETTVSGSLVTTSGGSEDRPLALLTWGTSADGVTASTIESIIASAGADVLHGDASDNTFTFTGGSGSGADILDGRTGTDTADFSAVVLGGSTGIVVHLGSTGTGDAGTPIEGAHGEAELIGGSGATIALLEGIENLIASSGDDAIAGSSDDNVLTGGEGSDTFLFVGFSNGEEQVGMLIGHDTITDLDLSGASGSRDRLALSTFLLAGLGETSTQEGRVAAFLEAYGYESDTGFKFVFDDDSSILLATVTRSDLSEHAVTSDWSKVESGNFFYF